MLNPNETRIQRRNSALGANVNVTNHRKGKESHFADTRSEMAASLRTLIRSRSERHPSRSRTTSTSNPGGWVDPTITDNNGSIPSRGKFVRAFLDVILNTA